VYEIAAPLPWLLPGIALAGAVSVLAGGSVARWLGVRRSIATFGVFALGLILASTLTPIDAAFVDYVNYSRGVRVCDLSRTWLPPPSEMLSGSDATLNILLFVPLGAAIGIAPWSARKLVVLVVALALSPTIEALQLFMQPLHRGCESADVVDNLSGLVAGLVVGMTLAWLAPVLKRPRLPDEEPRAR